MAAARAAASLVGSRLAEADIAMAAALLQQEVDPQGSVQASPAAWFESGSHVRLGWRCRDG